jgi:hypothetical protein
MVCVVAFLNHSLCLWAIQQFPECFGDSQNSSNWGIVLHIANKKSLFWVTGVWKTMLLLNFFCLKILIMIWFLQTVVCVQVTWVCMEKQKSSHSGFAKKQCSPPSRDVRHRVSHPKILNFQSVPCEKFNHLSRGVQKKLTFWHYVAK